MIKRQLSQRLPQSVADTGASQPGGQLQRNPLKLGNLQFNRRSPLSRTTLLHPRSPLSRTLALLMMLLPGALLGNGKRKMQSPWNTSGRTSHITHIAGFAFMQNALVLSTGAAP